MLNVAGSMSTNTGFAPTRPITSAVLIQVKGTVMTSSPGADAQCAQGISRLSVPLATVRQCLTPDVARQQPASNSRDLGPHDELTMVENPLHALADLSLVAPVLLFEINEFHELG